jgi:hypothetical protein
MSKQSVDPINNVGLLQIEAKSRTFLVKVKDHRGKPLNEGADDLAEADREM